MIKLFTKKRKGFTLIELIVVIAILGILAALAIPRFTGVRESANQGVDDQTAALLQNGIQLYHAANQKYPTNGGAEMKEAVTNVFEGGTIPTAKVTGNKFWYNSTDGTVKAAIATPGNGWEELKLPTT